MYLANLGSCIKPLLAPTANLWSATACRIAGKIGSTRVGSGGAAGVHRAHGAAGCTQATSDAYRKCSSARHAKCGVSPSRGAPTTVATK